jgi:Raf kinase inhibitor-like YbhB/YbcL family protein
LYVAIAACGGDETSLEPEVSYLDIQVTSDAFTEGSDIPTKYTCDDRDVSPPLRWSEVPRGTQSIALISDDPDAPRGTWVHWVLFAIPPGVTELPEGVPATEVTTEGARQGKNDFGRIGYGGPCPPPGGPHRYFFKLYALDTELDLDAGAEKKDVVQGMDSHILASGQLMGRYQRK